MNEQSPISIEPGLTIPYLDQWFGTWFIEPERGRALHSAIGRLNIGVHLQSRSSALPASAHTPHRLVKAERDALAQNPDGTPSAIDWEQVPRSRGAYAYRNIDGVAILELNGSLMKHEASATESTSTVMMRRSVRKLMADDQVKAVIFQVDSPGGTVAGIYDLATDIAALAKVKPVHAHASNLCASAAYLLASQMRSISATASSLIGSLGTYGVVYDLSEMAAKEGVKVHLLKGRINGRDALMKGAGTPGTEITDEQLARMQEGTDDLNQQFYAAVLAGPRKPKAAAVESWFADAGVWVAAKAKTMGLIDRIESFDDLLARVSGGAGKMNQSNVGGMSVHGADVQAEDAGTPANPEAETKEATMSQPHTGGQTATQTAPASQEPEKTVTGGEAEPRVAAAPDPKPATIAELEAAFPGDAQFVLRAAKLGWNMSEAKASYDVIQSHVASRTAEAGDPIAAPPAARKPGVPALSSVAAEQRTSAAPENPVAAFIDRRDQLVRDKGMTRAQAVMKIAADDPDLHQAYIESANRR